MQIPLVLSGECLRTESSQTLMACHLQLSEVEGVTIYGPPPPHARAALCSFNVAGLHANDISTLLDTSGVSTFRSCGT